MRARSRFMVLLLLALLASACVWRNRGTESFETPPPGKVLVVMYSTPNIMKYAKLAERINNAYCKRHGYAFKHVIGRDDDTSMRPVWKKVFLVRDELRDYDAVFWIDSDAIFHDHTKPLPLGGNEDVLIGSDWPNGPSLVNTGTFLVKRTAFGREFMERWAGMMTKLGATYNSKFPFEQGAAEDLIRSLGKDSSRVKVAPAETINSIFGKISRGNFDNLFIVHLMACPTSYRYMVFKKWLKLNGMWTEEDDRQE